MKNPFSNNNAKSQNDTRLQKYFLDSLKDIYWAEKLLIKTLPKMATAATSETLSTAFKNHLQVTKVHVERLEQVFKLLGKSAIAKKCEAMDGLVKEGKSIIDETEKNTATRDVGLIMAAQKVEHYEIATYGALAQLARTLGETKIAEIFDKTLADEKEADQDLTTIAEDGVNYQASTETRKVA